MIQSALRDFKSPVEQLVLVVSSLNTLETALPVVWREKSMNPGLVVKAIFLRETSLTGTGKTHPLLILATEVLDEMAIPYGLGWRHWSGPVDNPKLEYFFRKSSRISRALNLFVGLTQITSSHSVRRVVRMLGLQASSKFQPCVAMFDYDYIVADIKYIRFLKELGAQFALGVSHTSTLSLRERHPEWIDSRRNGTHFLNHLSFLSWAEQVRVLFDAQDKRRDVGNFIITAPTIDRFNSDWLKWVGTVFSRTISKYDPESPFGLLISRGGIKEDRKLRRQALMDVRQALEQLGLRPLILLHPSEKFRRSELIGWQVVDDVHYSLLVANAQRIISFGSQIAEDVWRSGKKVIEYGAVKADWPQSEFFKLGKADFAGSPTELVQALGARGESKN